MDVGGLMALLAGQGVDASQLGGAAAWGGGGASQLPLAFQQQMASQQQAAWGGAGGVQADPFQSAGVDQFINFAASQFQEQGAGKAALVEQVKSLQRRDEQTKKQWWQFCKKNGQGGSADYDPNRHDEQFLAHFLLAVENGELPAVESSIPTVAETPEKALLVTRVKEVQRSSADNKQTWYGFCGLKGTSNFDPMRHEESFLQEYIQNFESGALGGDPTNAVSQPKPQKQRHHAAAVPVPVPDDTEITEKVFVTNLPQGTDEDLLRVHFEAYGPVKEIDLKRDPDGSFRGFGFVVFNSANTAREVIKHISQSGIFGGNKINIKPAKDDGASKPAGGCKGKKGKGKGSMNQLMQMMGKGGDDDGDDGDDGWGDDSGCGGGGCWGAMNPMMMQAMMMKGMMGGKMGGKGMGGDDMMVPMPMAKGMMMKGMMGKGMGKMGKGGFGPY